MQSSHKVVEVSYPQREKSAEEKYPKSLRYDETVIEVALDDIASAKATYPGIVPVSAWHIEESDIKKLKRGETLILPLGGIEYPVRITDTSRMGKSMVITAFYEDEGNRYPAVVTVGKKTTFVSLQTPNGGYQSTLIASDGYVYSNASIEDAYADKSQSDTVTVTSNRDLDIIPR